MNTHVHTQKQRHVGDTIPATSKYTRQERQKVDLEQAVTQLFWGHFPKQLEHQHSEMVSGPFSSQLAPLTRTQRKMKAQRIRGYWAEAWQDPCQPPVLQVGPALGNQFRSSSPTQQSGWRFQAEVQGGSTAECSRRSSLDLGNQAGKTWSRP